MSRRKLDDFTPWNDLIPLRNSLLYETAGVGSTCGFLVYSRNLQLLESTLFLMYFIFIITVSANKTRLGVIFFHSSLQINFQFQSTSEPAPKVEPKKEENKSTISKAEFDEIKNGMSYEEVAKIIGSEGELLSEVGSKGEQFHTVMYMYTGEGDLGANANFTSKQ
nr:hypothetical protein [Brevibacillus laterosporus]